MLYAAIDIHKRIFHAAVLDLDTGETVKRRFAATREELNNWAIALQGKLAAVATEATTGWRCHGVGRRQIVKPRSHGPAPTARHAPLAAKRRNVVRQRHGTGISVAFPLERDS